MALTARISLDSNRIIDELVNKTGKSKIEIIEEALELYRFHERMRLFNESYEKLRSDDYAWEQELNERKQLDGTLGDGFQDE